jgi:phosphoribosyl-AMP cyclohydrolase
MNDPAWFDSLRWTPDGLVPAIVQDARSGDVLMMAWMDRAALRRTIESGQTHFYSRSRRASWHKGATSGHVQQVEELRIDCDADVLLVRVRQVGGACHEGYPSCFYRRVDGRDKPSVVLDRAFDPKRVYGGGAP